MSDMPAIIYMRTITVVGFVTIDIYMPLYKLLSDNESCICGENNNTNIIEYWSMPFHYKRSAANEFDMCCQIFGLGGSCSGNECTWRFTSYNPMLWEHGVDPKHQEFLTVPTEISCGTIEGGFVYNESIGSSGNQCVNALIVTQTITISKSIPGGVLATECHNMCCGQPLELFLTINAPDCPDIDGQVITLTFSGAVMNMGSPPTYNINGTMTVYWAGKMLVPGGCPTTVVVSNNTWSANTTAQCNWNIEIRVGPFICFEDTQTENDKSFCPPLTFSGTWNPDAFEKCEMCCIDLSMTFDLDL